MIHDNLYPVAEFIHKFYILLGDIICVKRTCTDLFTDGLSDDLAVTSQIVEVITGIGKLSEQLDKSW